MNDLQGTLHRAWSRAVRNPLTHIVLSGIFLWLDSLSGPFLQFPATFVIPVALSAWYCGRNLAVILAIAQPFLHMVLTASSQDQGWAMLPYLATNAVIRIAVLTLLAYFVHRGSVQNRDLARRVGLLRGMIPVCVECKKFKDENDSWVEVESYVTSHTGANLVPALCESCRTGKHGDISLPPQWEGGRVSQT